MFGLASIEVGYFHDIRDVEGAFAFHNRRLGVLLALAHVPLDHVRTFDDDSLFFSDDGDDAAAFAFIGTGDHHHFVILLYVKSRIVFL